MFKSKIVSARELENGDIEHTVHGKPNVIRRYYSVRIGVSWPAVGVSGAAVVLGMPVRSGPGSLGGGPNWFSDSLELLAEHQHSDLGLQQFFSVIAEFSEIFLSEVTYVDFSDASCYDPFRQFASERDQTLRFADTPYRNNPFAAVSMVKDRLRVGALVLHNSEVKREASRLELDDISDNMKKSFPLTTALAAAVSGFLAHPPSRPIERPEVLSLSEDGGWMAG